MTVQLQSTNISLLVGYEPEPSDVDSSPDELLWQTLRTTTVEPTQTSSPFFVSFADECLLCAHIAVNNPTPTASTDNHDADRDTKTAKEENSPMPTDRRAGLIYLHTGPANPASEANIGVIMRHDMRHRGYAREAVQLVLGWAFEEFKFHRVQAAILDTPYRDRALRLFIGSGFTHEGTRRRAVRQPEEEGLAGAWRDVTYLAMLDTEWMLQSVWKQTNQVQGRPVVTVWDEMFARHAREREDLIKWEERYERMRKPSSTETLKEKCENVRNASPDTYLTDDTSSEIGESSRHGSPSPVPSPRLNVVVSWDDADIEAVSDLDELRHQWRAATRGRTQYTDSASLQPSQLDRMLSLPSIPSTRLSEGNPQSLLTIPSSPGSSSPASSLSSPSTTSWLDSEDEGGWSPNPDLPPPMLPVQLASPRGPLPLPVPASIRSGSRSNSTSSCGSTDSWSDAQSNFGISSSTWDVISNTSDHSLRVPLEQ